jgi:hypothetical protein
MATNKLQLGNNLIAVCIYLLGLASTSTAQALKARTPQITVNQLSGAIYIQVVNIQGQPFAGQLVSQCPAVAPNACVDVSSNNWCV